MGTFLTYQKSPAYNKNYCKKRIACQDVRISFSGMSLSHISQDRYEMSAPLRYAVILCNPEASRSAIAAGHPMKRRRGFIRNPSPFPELRALETACLGKGRGVFQA